MKSKALGILGVGILGVGFAPIFVQSSGMSPTVSAFWRFALAIPFLALLSGTFRERHVGRPPVARDYALLAVSGLVFGVAITTFHWSIHYTSVATASLLGNLAPIVVTLIAWAFGSKISRRFLAGLILAVTGMVVLRNARLDLANELLGNTLGVLTAILYGSYLYMCKRLRENFSSVTILLWDCVVSSVMIGILCMQAGLSLAPPDGATWIQLVGMTVLAQVIGRTAIIQAMRELPVIYSSANLLLVPFVSIVLAIVILGEKVTPGQLLGGLIMISGLLVAQWPQAPAIPVQAVLKRKPRKRLPSRVRVRARRKSVG